MITGKVLIDTGPLVAMLSAADQHHARCVALAKLLAESPLTCWPVITEATYLLRQSPLAVQAILSRVEQRAIEILPLSLSDVRAVATILSNYSDQSFDLADACLMHLTDREGIDTVFTTDRRHFSVYRGRTGKPVYILPTD